MASVKEIKAVENLLDRFADLVDESGADDPIVMAMLALAMAKMIARVRETMTPEDAAKIVKATETVFKMLRDESLQ